MQQMNAMSKSNLNLNLSNQTKLLGFCFLVSYLKKKKKSLYKICSFYIKKQQQPTL